MFNILNCLPEEILVTILSEWIDCLTFSAFDAALCDRSLREQYLWIFQSYSSTVVSKMHFETVNNHYPYRFVPFSFFYWCMKRELRPKSLTMVFMYPPFNTAAPPTKSKKPGVLDVEVFRDIEILKDCHLIIDSQPEGFPIYEFLRFLPKLKVLNVHCVNRSNLSNYIPNNLQHYIPNNLMCLELHEAVFASKKEGFHVLVQAFANLEVLKLIRCPNINLGRLQYIMNHHAKHLTSLHYISNYDYLHFCELPDTTDVTIQPNPALKELVLDLKEMKQETVDFEEEESDESDDERSQTEDEKDGELYDTVCAILTQCPCVEKASLHHINFGNMKGHKESPFHFDKIIRKNWRHLQSLELLSTTDQVGVTKKNLQPIAKACGSILTRLRLTCMAETETSTDTAIYFLCESFPRLEILELCYELPPKLIEALMQASFRHNLHTLVILGHQLISHPKRYTYIQNAIFDRFSVYITETKTNQIFLEAFPALKTLKLRFYEYVQVITPFPAMTQITTLVLEPSIRRCPPIRFLPSTEAAVTAQMESFSAMNDHPAEDFTMLDLSGYTALQHLTLVSFYFYPEEFANILQLPTLRTLKLVDIWAKHEHILFHPSNYPASHLSPLHTLDVSEKIESREDKLAFTEQSLRVFLHRFASTLSIVKAPKNRWGLEESVWLRVKEDHRYRVALSSL